MSTVEIITDELVRSLAPNAAAISNGQKISRTGGFTNLCRTEDGTLIFGECKGSGKTPYKTSVDFSGDAPIFRCSCPSRQFPCKHGLALMYEWLAKKSFTVSEVPEDVAQKREKLAKRTEKAQAAENGSETVKENKKTDRKAAEKKLKKQAEGLELAEGFVNDLLNRGVSSINSSSAPQYRNLAKQLGDYYLPEPQAIMLEIINAAEKLSENPNDEEVNRLVGLCVRLSSSVRKCQEYIRTKLESGEVLPEDNILYEAMGNVWKLTQLKQLGLCKENARLMQLSFAVLSDEIHKAEIDTAYWVDMESGEISKTENIRPLRAAKYVKAEDSAFGLYKIKELCRYPGGLNRRIRWDAAEITEPDADVYRQILSLADTSISEVIKKAKNELKNTLSDDAVAVLLSFEQITFAVADGHGVLQQNSETIALRSNADYPQTCQVCQVLSMAGNQYLRNGALLGELFYSSKDRRFYLCPISIVTVDGIVRLS